MELYYENSKGEKVNLMANGIYAQNPEKLIESEWKYNTISNINGVGRIKNFYREIQETSLTLSIMADTKEEYNKILEQLHRITEYDVRKNVPGRLWWNDFYKSVNCYATSYDDFDELFECVEKEIKFVSTEPVWIREKFFSFREMKSTQIDGDYCFDYDFDYIASTANIYFENTSIAESNFEMTVYGPCDNPEITINEHRYIIYISLLENEYAKIDSKTRKIIKTSRYGEVENIFHYRDRDNNIFEKIPDGENTASWSMERGFDLKIYDERGEPIWI